MNLGQAVAVCLYELTARAFTAEGEAAVAPSRERAAASERLELLAGVVEQAMVAADYSPAAMREANRHDLRLLLRRVAPAERDLRRMLGLFRRILWRFQHPAKSGNRNSKPE
jgi:tRNA C32,U32 (ribose-2'-O)-methylase TrmJ